jgi:hypothetical protein
VVKQTSIEIEKHEAKEALALFAHIRQLIRTAFRSGAFLRPVEMDQADLLICAASLRHCFLMTIQF